MIQHRELSLGSDLNQGFRLRRAADRVSFFASGVRLGRL
jgi:hypothetical protein